MGLSVGIVGLPNVGKSTSCNALTAADALTKAIAAANEGTPLRAVAFTDEELAALRELNLITLKPVLYVANVGEGDLGTETPLLAKVRAVAAAKKGEIVVICGELE